MVLNLSFLNETTQSSTEIGNSNIIKLPSWLAITFAVVFFILAIASFLLYQLVTIKKLRKYKDEQLKDYIKDNPKRKNITYERTGMYVPSWERMKYNSPLFLTVVFGILAVFFFVSLFL